MGADETRNKARPSSAEQARAARLKAALKANIAKRKAQARARGGTEKPDETDKA